jgi:mannose-6-phosphate isomerase
VAELWFGAHRDAPSPVPQLATTLDALVAADPVGTLGREVSERSEAQLPFLLKLIAAELPLSLQVHPTKAQAAAGYEAEHAAGSPVDAPERNYHDHNHKPELLCALTPFEALVGFRPAEHTTRLLDALAVPALAPVRDLLARGDVRAAFTRLLHEPDPAALSSAVAARIDVLADGQWRATAQAVRRAAAAFSGDIGVVLALLLNAVRLAPGEAVFLGPGTVHSYLHGTAVEIMANSDNVLRCGLTRKHVDVTELCKITDFVSLPEPRWPDIGGVFEVPVPDFRLTRLQLVASEPMSLHDAGPLIVLCASGALSVGELRVRPGHAAFVAAGTRVRLAGDGLAFVAGDG